MLHFSKNYTKGDPRSFSDGSSVFCCKLLSVGLPASKLSPVVKASSVASCLLLDCITAQETSKQTSIFGGSSGSVHRDYFFPKKHTGTKSPER